jgi:multiple sugar transport system substrate-binding protein
VIKRVYTEAMDPEVLAWDDASNNRCLNAGKCIAIHNPISGGAPGRPRCPLSER